MGFGVRLDEVPDALDLSEVELAGLEREPGELACKRAQVAAGRGGASEGLVRFAIGREEVTGYRGRVCYLVLRS